MGRMAIVVVAETTATPSATSQALQNGQTVVFTDSGTRITTEAQSMAAKDA